MPGLKTAPLSDWDWRTPGAGSSQKLSALGVSCGNLVANPSWLGSGRYLAPAPGTATCRALPPPPPVTSHWESSHRPGPPLLPPRGQELVVRKKQKDSMNTNNHLDLSQGAG